MKRKETSGGENGMCGRPQAGESGVCSRKGVQHEVGRGGVGGWGEVCWRMLER